VVACRCCPGGRPAGHCRRDIVDAIRYLVKEGICWRAMPANFPPWQTVYAVLDHWQDSGATEAMHGELRRQCWLAATALRRPQPGALGEDARPNGPACHVTRRSRQAITTVPGRT
jgi:putative transposase